MSDGTPSAARRPRVIVLGGVQADVIAGPVTDLPPAGATMLIDQAGLRVGGAGANAALAFSALHAEVRLLGCVGDDALGVWMRDELAPHGLGDELAVVAGQSTGMTVALESAQRDRTFLTYLGVNAGWKPSLTAAALDCDAFLLCDYFVMPGLREHAAHRLLATARAQGARTFFDTAWDPEDFPESSRREVLALLDQVDVFLPNEAEACALAGAQDAQAAAARLQEASGAWVVVKLGARGALARGPGGATLRAHAPVVSVSDTTGAGDAFNAGLVRALADGADWRQALQAATEFASAVVAVPSAVRYRPAPGGQQAIPQLRSRGP